MMDYYLGGLQSRLLEPDKEVLLLPLPLLLLLPLLHASEVDQEYDCCC